MLVTSLLYSSIYIGFFNKNVKNSIICSYSNSLAEENINKNINKYKNDREYILQLSNYISSNKEFLDEPVSVNERSFEIWNREKFLQKEGGYRILKNLGFSPHDLNIYETTEPLSYYSHHLGDSNYEGILIYERLSDIFMDQIPIKPFTEAYVYM